MLLSDPLLTVDRISPERKLHREASQSERRWDAERGPLDHEIKDHVGNLRGTLMTPLRSLCVPLYVRELPISPSTDIINF